MGQKSRSRNEVGSLRNQPFRHASVEALARLLDLPDLIAADGTLAPMLHTLTVPDWPDLGGLGEDGHPGSDVEHPPEVAGCRRVFAGGRSHLLRRVPTDAVLRRSSRLLQVQQKQGRSGQITFVTARHVYHDAKIVYVVDDVDLAYLRLPPHEVAPAPGEASKSAIRDETDTLVSVGVDEVTLFCFSAMTHNAHRIHYDRAYANAEGHPSLVVHGPLLVILLAVGLVRRGLGWEGHTLQHRLLRPTYAPTRVEVISEGDNGACVAQKGGDICAQARLTPLLLKEPSSDLLASG